MAKVYGASDDLVEIEGSTYRWKEIDCYERDVIVYFADGTSIRIGYSKPDIGVWWINVIAKGTAKQTLTICEDEEADPYSDIFEIDSEVIDTTVVNKAD